MLERFFGLRARGTTVRRVLLGGAPTFATMAYIVVVNPAILGFAGLPVGPSTVATILAAVFGTLLMGLYANRPIAVAPYMGENAFIAFGLAALGVSWPQLLGAVFVSGLAFLWIALLGIRSWLPDAISPSLKHSFAVGIGLFLALIGLYESGIVTSGAAGLPAASLLDPARGLLRAPAVPLKIGDLHDPRVLLAILGFLVMAVLLQRRVRGALLIGIAATAILGYALGLGEIPKRVLAVPFTGEYSLAPLLLKLDVAGVLKLAFVPALLAVGLLMSSSFARIDFEDLTELVPAFVTITLMVFTYNIGNGLTAGLLVHPIAKAAAGRFREVKPGGLALAFVCGAYYLFGLPH